MRHEKYETHMETNIESLLKKKGENPYSESVADRTSNRKKIPINIYD